jgi:hypothetical protein
MFLDSMELILSYTGWAISRLTLVRDLNAFLYDLWPTLYKEVN